MADEKKLVIFRIIEKPVKPTDNPQTEIEKAEADLPTGTQIATREVIAYAE